MVYSGDIVIVNSLIDKDIIEELIISVLDEKEDENVHVCFKNIIKIFFFFHLIILFYFLNSFLGIWFLL